MKVRILKTNEEAYFNDDFAIRMIEQGQAVPAVPAEVPAPAEAASEPAPAPEEPAAEEAAETPKKRSRKE